MNPEEIQGKPDCGPLTLLGAQQSFAAALAVFTPQVAPDNPSCPKCGHVSFRNGNSFKCLNCGESISGSSPFIEEMGEPDCPACGTITVQRGCIYKCLACGTELNLVGE